MIQTVFIKSQAITDAYQKAIPKNAKILREAIMTAVSTLHQSRGTKALRDQESKDKPIGNVQAGRELERRGHDDGPRHNAKSESANSEQVDLTGDTMSNNDTNAIFQKLVKVLGKRPRKEVESEDETSDHEPGVFKNASEKSTRLAVVSISAVIGGLRPYKLVAYLGQNFKSHTAEDV